MLKQLKENITLLTEDVAQSKVINAIKRCKYVKVNYESDEDPKGSGERIIEPVAFGKSKAGNLVVRAYQPFGDTKTKVPHWKFFRLDRFINWEPMKKVFKELPDDFNPNGDKTMSEVYLICDLLKHNKAYDKYEKSGLKTVNDKRQKEKEEQPFYQLKKNIEHKAPTYLQKLTKQNIEKYGVGQGAQQWVNGASAEEMANTTNFGDQDYVQTDGPIYKNQYEPTQKDTAKYNIYKYGVGQGAQQWVSGDSEEEMSKNRQDDTEQYEQTPEDIAKYNLYKYGVGKGAKRWVSGAHGKEMGKNLTSDRKKSGYQNVALNGPVYKGQEQEKEENKFQDSHEQTPEDIARYNIEKYGVGKGAKRWVSGAQGREMGKNVRKDSRK